jgi:squalene synthase HpnC
MTKPVVDLELYGPHATAQAAPSLGEGRRYCRRLAHRHYENFTVASLLAPRRLRQHLCNIYAYCRWADDLADETADPGQSLALLDWWEGQLRACLQGQPATHPVFAALGETIRTFDIPAEPLVNLLVAFRQDQAVDRYETFDHLLDYCRYSANPVGHLVLYVGRSYDPERARLADSICTGLQLANFCQDVAGDFRRGRIYLPQVECRRFGYTAEMFARGEANEPFRRLMALQVERAEGWLRQGLPLVDRIDRGLRLPVLLFAEGGLAILDAVRRRQYDVWTSRPTLSRGEKLRLAVRSWWRLRRNPSLATES